MGRLGVNFGAMRALVALSNEQLADYIWHFLKDNGAHNVKVVHHSNDAVNHMVQHEFTHFFIGHHLKEFGGPDFARFIRMSNGAPSEAPIIMIMSDPDRAKVMDSRDSGVTEIISIPFTGQQLEERLSFIAAKPKKFIRATSYIGPDRRRAKTFAYRGVERRQQIVREAKPQKAGREKISDR